MPTEPYPEGLFGKVLYVRACGSFVVLTPGSTSTSQFASSIGSDHPLGSNDVIHHESSVILSSLPISRDVDETKRTAKRFLAVRSALFTGDCRLFAVARVGRLRSGCI
jgi:negative regulator of replication initiation